MKCSKHLLYLQKGGISHPINFPVSLYFILYYMKRETVLKRAVFFKIKKPTYTRGNVGFFLFDREAGLHPIKQAPDHHSTETKRKPIKYKFLAL